MGYGLFDLPELECGTALGPVVMTEEDEGLRDVHATSLGLELARRWRSPLNFACDGDNFLPNIYVK
jgi:hypothetical protein